MTKKKQVIGGWVCANVDSKQIRRNNAVELIRSDLKKIFGSSLEEVVIAGAKLDDNSFESSVENYIFIKTKDYYKGVQGLRASRIISSVLSDYSNPSFISEEEVRVFAEGSLLSDEKDFEYADVVKVKEGTLKDLKGIVLKKKEGEIYEVFFRMCTRQFTENLHRDNLLFDTNIIDRLRIPLDCSIFRNPSKSGRTPVLEGIDEDLVWQIIKDYEGKL